MELKHAFPEQFFDHAVAVKANPMPHLLRRAVDLGIGLECASVAELHHALSLGAKTVIFDSPCKSKDALRLSVVDNDKVYVNLDNEYEIEIVSGLIGEAKVRLLQCSACAHKGRKHGRRTLVQRHKRTKHLLSLFLSSSPWFCSFSYGNKKLKRHLHLRISQNDGLGCVDSF